MILDLPRDRVSFEKLSLSVPLRRIGGHLAVCITDFSNHVTWQRLQEAANWDNPPEELVTQDLAEPASEPPRPRMEPSAASTSMASLQRAGLLDVAYNCLRKAPTARSVSGACVERGIYDRANHRQPAAASNGRQIVFVTTLEGWRDAVRVLRRPATRSLCLLNRLVPTANLGNTYVQHLIDEQISQGRAEVIVASQAPLEHVVLRNVTSAQVRDLRDFCHLPCYRDGLQSLGRDGRNVAQVLWCFEFPPFYVDPAGHVGKKIGDVFRLRLEKIQCVQTPAQIPQSPRGLLGDDFALATTPTNTKLEEGFAPKNSECVKVADLQPGHLVLIGDGGSEEPRNVLRDPRPRARKATVVLAYSDASWANAEQCCSQCGVLIVLCPAAVLQKTVAAEEACDRSAYVKSVFWGDSV
eukprot:s4891_g1.t1